MLSGYFLVLYVSFCFWIVDLMHQYQKMMDYNVKTAFGASQIASRFLYPSGLFVLFGKINFHFESYFLILTNTYLQMIKNRIRSGNNIQSKYDCLFHRKICSSYTCQNTCYAWIWNAWWIYNCRSLASKLKLCVKKSFDILFQNCFFFKQVILDTPENRRDFTDGDVSTFTPLNHVAEKICDW